ncbi:MAG: hypothetical protein ACRD3A_03825 [Terriglobales bacterium]
MRSLRSLLLASLFSIALLAPAQQSAPPPLTPEQEEAAAKAQQMGDLMTVVKKQFGPDLEVAQTPSEVTARYLHPDKKKEAGWKFLLTGDLNGDGVEDAVIVVRFKNPLAGQAQFNYKVVDPYFTYHGYGNPKVTVEFQSEDPRYHNMILVIHGAGKEGWRAETPKEKFVIVNLPFEKLSVAPLMVKKKKVLAIMAEEAAGGSSNVYWDGKKYKWGEGAGGS